MTKMEKQQNSLQLAEPVVVVGLGKTGLSVARFLSEQGVDFSVVDSRDIPPGLQELKGFVSDKNIFVGGFKNEWFDSAETLIVSPGISIQEPVIRAAGERGAEIIGDIELFGRVNTVPVIAITGSNGKSTVTTLVAQMASDSNKQVRVGGNLGEPALDLLDDTAELYVLELSSFQLETTHTLTPAVSVILNICEDHMDRYDSFDDYVAAKAKIFNGHGIIVANLDDEIVMRLVDETGLQRHHISFGMKLPFEDNYGICPHKGETWICKGKNLLLSVDSLGIKGTHNVSNALAALALGEACDLPLETMLKTLQEYTGLPHRTQWVAECNGVNWFNDSKATNVGAAVAAIEGIPGENVVLIAGGQGKEQDFMPLANALEQRVSHVILIGEDAELIARVVPENVEKLYAKDLEDAVYQAAKFTKKGDSVLLSPACASFDMFRNYEQRGDAFINAVMEVCA